MSVVDFAQAKAEREPHSAGTRVCLGCRHEWVGVAPLGENTGLECPSCGMPKGVTKYLYGADVGDSEFRCNCGCEALTAFIPKSRSGAKFSCMACGADQTDALFE
jgi:hypothetical protein